ncbi:single-stranded DNA-binding protein, mitochondrial-like isoform X1 [Stegodyphus dumicola]|uniref:single-stranded DNA-binding protein, mitochondrial-like isoform X1 n=1 Tax=Stegodyphus dumicola TaxID=202533 RepID=UPI0015AF235E|nr:single-stranded DNA-binding protein, mitochondrial-like isoform X1 [Stegodyphus dumicola]
MFRQPIINSFSLTRSLLKNRYSLSTGKIRQFCDDPPRIYLEKSINQVILLGRVGINPQLRGTESKPVVVFTLATNTNYKYDSGEVHEKTDWHRISVFKPNLRNLVLDYLKKGSRVFVEGRIMYGEFTDAKGVIHNSTSIIANDIIFVSTPEKKEEFYPEPEE